MRLRAFFFLRPDRCTPRKLSKTGRDLVRQNPAVPIVERLARLLSLRALGCLWRGSASG